jgi:CheY-like chemotaxis protein
LKNALKFTPQGSVRLSVGLAPGFTPAAEEGQAGMKVTLLFAVEDTGIGIPADKQNAIFEGFTLAEDLMTKKYGGTGLGLAICKQLVEKMGGHIWVKSAPGQGSIFYFTVPLGAFGQDEACLLQGQAGPGAAVLYADSDQAHLAYTAWMLQNNGLSVVAVDSVRAAEAKLASGTFQALLLSVEMEPGAALDLVRRLRAGQVSEAARDLPILAISPPLTHEGELRHYQQSGVTEVLPQPFEHQALAMAIKRLATSSSQS